MQQRLYAIIADHIVGTVIFGIIFMTVNFDSLINPSESNIIKQFETFNQLLVFGMIYYIIKDIFSGRSIGKRIFGLIVTDIDNDIEPNKIRLITRNITILIWPIEVILLLVNGRRIGDIISKTQVKEYSSFSKKA